MSERDPGPTAGKIAAKIEVRAAVLAARRSMSAAVRDAADASLTATLAEAVRSRRAAVVTAYVPLPGEPGGAGLPEALADAIRPVGGRLLLPVLRDDLDLDWAEYDGVEGLRRTGRGLREPVGPRLGVAAVAGADLVIVPAVAVDRTGRRLGRGGGSYDRALVRVPGGTLSVAPIYAEELVPAVPAQGHDMPVGAVVVASTEGSSASWRSLPM